MADIITVSVGNQDSITIDTIVPLVITEIVQSNTITETISADSIVLTDTSSSLVISSSQGPPGISGGVAINVIAGENLGGHRAITLSNGLARYADNTSLASVNKVIGITRGSCIVGDIIAIDSIGELNGFSDLITDMPVYLSINGIVTATIPSVGFIQQLGLAISTTTIVINIQPSIILG